MGWTSRSNTSPRMAPKILTTLAIVALLGGVIGPGPVAAAPPWPDPDVGPTARTSEINRRIAARLRTRVRASALGSRVSITVWDTATKSVVFSRSGSRPMIGASNTKLLTGMLSLRELGPDFRLRTRVTQPGRGRIVLVGTGDQLLSSSDLAALAKATARALRRQRLKSVKVRVDDSLYVWRGPAQGWIGHEVSAYGPGRVRSLIRDDRRVADSAVDAARYFTDRLRTAGIRARYLGRGRGRGSRAIALSGGHTIAQVLKASLWPSDSDKAESLGRLMAVHRGKPGTWTGVWAAAREILRELKAPIEGVQLYDASGLSHRNRITTNLMVHLLRAAVSPREPRMNALLRRNSLATSGLTGTLSSFAGRFVSSSNRCAVGKVHAKTGTLGGVVALSGYAAGADGRWKIFSVLVNDRPEVPFAASRKAIDDIAAAIVGCA